MKHFLSFSSIFISIFRLYVWKILCNGKHFHENSDLADLIDSITSYFCGGMYVYDTTVRL